ncbi:MAG: prepilin-type N-terminal cleavage/methylation domain-containing protein, partial [Pseudomonadota bacterium]
MCSDRGFSMIELMVAV